MSREKFTRRQFAGAMAVVAAAPALLAQEKKAAGSEKKATEPSGDDEAQAMKRIREFAVAEGAEPAFAFRAAWDK